MECVNSHTRTCPVCSITLIRGENISKSKYDRNRNTCDVCSRQQSKKCRIKINQLCATDEKYKWRRVFKLLRNRVSHMRKKGTMHFDEYKILKAHLREKYPVLPTHCPMMKKMELIYKEMPYNSSLRDHSISIDRIDSTKGYVVENIQILCFRANTIKNNSTVEDAYSLFNYYNNTNKEETKQVLKKYDSVFFIKNNTNKKNKSTKNSKNGGVGGCYIEDDRQLLMKFDV